eukprot:CAMPEP_0184863018 /NCGR_PEP_ID=MMETSP0580-20130426/8327_1 /TAXON_ID=1118495 /ORGANISM="Dactyliosolen fragilissimus" /LENGTH=150 /DNA_ID=CAMNT_0027361061 /DNA_START=122 /DNA_END=574 /DNA_ORIENTATION=-
MDEIPDMGNAGERIDYENEAHSEIVRFLTQSDEMRSTARNALKQSLWSGGAAFAGSIVAGPVGGLVGGVAGSIVGFFQSDEYDGVLSAIVKLEATRRKKLVSEVGQILVVAGASQQLLNAAAFRDHLHRYADQEQVRNNVWKACLEAVRN